MKNGARAKKETGKEGEGKGQKGHHSGFSSRELHCSRCASRFQHSLHTLQPLWCFLLALPLPAPALFFLLEKNTEYPGSLSFFVPQPTETLATQKIAAGETSLLQ